MTIRTALEARKPELAADYTAFVTRRFERLTERFGPALRGIYNSDQARNWQAIANLTTRTGTRIVDHLVLDGGKVAAAADHYADEVIEAWIVKINAKMGQLDNATVCHIDGHRFAINGQKAGRSVRIEQDRIVNVSSQGTLFNQWPARIYLDGKFISAAKFAQI